MPLPFLLQQLVQSEANDIGRKAAQRGAGQPATYQPTPFDVLMHALRQRVDQVGRNGAQLAVPDFTGGRAVPAAPQAPAARVFQPAAPAAPVAGPSSAPAKVFEPSTGGDDYFERILRIEGGTDKKGNFLRSSAGAWGPAQLMPGTAPEAMELAGYSRDDQRWKTDAAVNTAAGRAYYEKQRATFGDPVVAAAAYNAGPGNVQKAFARANKEGGTWTQYLPAETQRYIQNFQAGGATGTPMPAFQGSFNPAMWNRALGQVDAAGKAQLTPFSTTLPMPPAPAFPDAPQMPKRDFSRTDALMQGMKPELDLERDRPRIERANLFAGLAKGLAGLPEGAGVGQVLAQVGAGLLAGRAAADTELQRRIDAFDQKMLAWQQAEFNYEGQKAETLHQDAVKEVGMIYQHNLNKFAADTQAFVRDHDVQMVGNNFVVRNRTDAGMEVKTVPIAPLIMAGTAMQKAQVMGQMAGAQQQSNAMVASANNQILAGTFAQEYARAQQERTQGAGASDQALTAFMASGVLQATELVNLGMGAQVLGDEAYAAAGAKAQERAQAEGFLPGDPKMAARVKELMIGDLTIGMMSNPKLMEQVKKVAPVLYQSYISQRLQRRTTTDAKGRTSVSETFDAE